MNARRAAALLVLLSMTACSNTKTAGLKTVSLRVAGFVEAAGIT